MAKEKRRDVFWLRAGMIKSRFWQHFFPFFFLCIVTPREVLLNIPKRLPTNFLIKMPFILAHIARIIMQLGESLRPSNVHKPYFVRNSDRNLLCRGGRERTRNSKFRQQRKRKRGKNKIAKGRNVTMWQWRSHSQAKPTVSDLAI